MIDAHKLEFVLKVFLLQRISLSMRLKILKQQKFTIHKITSHALMCFIKTMINVCLITPYQCHTYLKKFYLSFRLAIKVSIYLPRPHIIIELKSHLQNPNH